MRMFTTDTDDVLCLDTFLAKIAAIASPRFSAAYLEAAALHLRQLANNENLIWDWLQPEIGDTWERSFSAPQSFIMAMSDEAIIRANIWVPSKKRGGFAAYEDEVYSYGLAHNHDFRLLTVGYHGPGYETDVYEFHDERREVPPGEAVLLQNHRREQLSQGRVWMYEQYTDVHIQHEPDALSISLNVLFRNEEKPRDQLFFDVEASRVVGPVRLAYASRLVTAMNMARHFHNRQTPERLTRVAEHHPFGRVRSVANEVLHALNAPNETARTAWRP